MYYFVLEKGHTKPTKMIKKIYLEKNFENLEKSWNFVGQPQWEPWQYNHQSWLELSSVYVCVCKCVCV